MQLAQVLAEFGRSLDIPDLALEEDDSCVLALDGGHELALLHRPEIGALDLAIPLAMPAGDEAQGARLCRRLLEIQLLGEATCGAVIALNEDELVEVQRRLWLRDDLEARDLVAAVAELNGVARHLVTELGLLPPEA